MHTTLRNILALATLALSAPALADKTDSKISLVNKSHWAIHELYFSPSDEREWGEDQLGKQTINSGETFTLHHIPCNTYDVKLVDEDGDECVVEDVAVCADKEAWTISDKDLLKCQAKTQ